MSKYMIDKEARLTARQVCQYLRMCRKTLYRLVERRRLIGYKTPRGWRFKWADVIAYARIKYPGRVFPAAMLMTYHQAPYKYQVTKEKRGLIGRLSLRPEYLKRLSPEKRAREYFSRMKKSLRRTASGSRSVTHGGLPHSGKPVSKKELACEYFKPIPYHRIRLEGGLLIMVSPLVG